MQDLYGVFSLRTYDSLNPADKGFLKDYERFNDKVTSLDRLATTYCCVFNRFSTHTTEKYILCRKLGAILGRAFEDCIVSESLFKLLYIFGILLKKHHSSASHSVTTSEPKLQQLQISGSLADRKLISTELTEKMPLLIELLNNEMDNAKEIFDQQEVVLLPLMSVQFLTNYLVLRREFEGLGRR